MITNHSSTLSRKRHFLLFSILALIILGISCKKGDTGPAGPKGTANVIYSDWFTPSAYTKDTIFGTYGLYYDKAASDITQAIVDSGTVITYGKLVGYNPTIWPATQVSAMPITVTYRLGSTINNDTWSALVKPGNLRIQFINDQNTYSVISTLHQFRYIIIPGGAKSTATSSANPQFASGTGNEFGSAPIDYTHMSYDEVCQRLGVPR